MGRLEEARVAAERAMELEPDLPQAHLALGRYYYSGFRDYDRALEELSATDEADRVTVRLVPVEPDTDPLAHESFLVAVDQAGVHPLVRTPPDLVAFPLTDARAAGVREDDTADLRERGELAVALDRRLDLLLVGLWADQHVDRVADDVDAEEDQQRHHEDDDQTLQHAAGDEDGHG